MPAIFIYIENKACREINQGAEEGGIICALIYILKTSIIQYTWMYFLDTNICIYFLKGVFPVLKG